MAVAWTKVAGAWEKVSGQIPDICSNFKVIKMGRCPKFAPNRLSANLYLFTVAMMPNQK